MHFSVLKAFPHDFYKYVIAINLQGTSDGRYQN
jgi:hypothetical protein